MARKKKEPDVPEATPETPAAVQATAVLPPPPEANGKPEVNGHAELKPLLNGEAKKNRPAASFSCYSDRTTRIEIACWQKQIKDGDSEYTQYTLTLSRSWQKDGVWQGNAAFRVHDLAVLAVLLRQAHDWCVSKRCTVKFDDESLPF